MPKANFARIMKSIFPKPIVPQKRYIFLFGAIIYLITKIYVNFTPTLDDDHWPDKVRDAMDVMFVDYDNEPLGQDE